MAALAALKGVPAWPNPKIVSRAATRRRQGELRGLGIRRRQLLRPAGERCELEHCRPVRGIQNLSEQGCLSARGHPPFQRPDARGLKPTIRDIYAEGDTVIVFFDASGMARDGRPYANTYAWLLDLKNGKVVKASAFFDSIVFNDFWQRVQPDPSKSRKE
jgi:hypothetical protein